MAVKKQKIKRTKKDMEALKHQAFIYFMQGVQQTEIAERLEVSNQTITDWKIKGNWDVKRAAKTISMQELVNKALQRINELLDSKENFNADAFAKAVAQLKTLMPSNTVDDKVMAFLSFQNFLFEIRGIEPGVDADFIRKVTSLQDKYVNQQIGDNE